MSIFSTKRSAAAQRCLVGGGIVVGVPFVAINKALQRILFEVVNLCGWSTFGRG
jgi:hypothetical protein